MITTIKTLALLAASTIFMFMSCSKSEFENEFGNEESIMILENGYNSSIISTIEKPSDYAYNTKGVIEYSKNGHVVATFTYGDGTKDSWATLTKNSIDVDIDLAAKKKSNKYTKVITSPLIKTEDCNYIVEGTIKYFKGLQWVATVDFGDGTCDEWATKTWQDGSKTFSLTK